MELGLIALGAFVLVLGALVLGRIIQPPAPVDATPLSTCADAMPGRRLRFKGRLQTRSPVTAPLADKPCAYFGVQIYGKVDSGGALALLESNDDGPSLLESSKLWADDAFIEDETGRIALDAVGEDVEVYAIATDKWKLPVGRKDDVLRDYGFAHARSTSIYEQYLPSGTEVVVVGTVGERGSGLRVKGPGLIVSALSEKDLEQRRGWNAPLIGGVLVLAGAVLIAVGALDHFGPSAEAQAPVRNLPMQPLAHDPLHP